MKIMSLNNNTNTYYHKSNIDFGNVYKLEVNKKLFNSKSNVYRDFQRHVIGLFKLLSSQKEADVNLSVRAETGFKSVKKAFKGFAKLGSELRFNLTIETPKYVTYERLQGLTGCASWWLARHLGIEQPKTLSETHHTFFLYTGKDSKDFSKINSIKNTYKTFKKNEATISDKTFCGEYRKEDAGYWKQILFAQDLEQSINKMNKEKNIRSITINHPLEMRKLYEDMEKSIKFD